MVPTIKNTCYLKKKPLKTPPKNINVTAAWIHIHLALLDPDPIENKIDKKETFFTDPDFTFRNILCSFEVQ
jgi:hypothetical protein